MADIFISYAREDQTRIEPLASALAEQGWSVWWDRRIPAGRTWREVIGEALDAARAVVVAWSEDSIASRWVHEEADRGLERRILVPVFLDDVRPPLGFGAVQAVDLTQWTPSQPSSRFDTLIAALELILGPSPLKTKVGEQARAEQVAAIEAKRKEEERQRASETQPRRQAGEEKRRKASDNQRIEEDAERRQQKEQQLAEAETKRKESEPRHKQASSKTGLWIGLLILGLILSGATYWIANDTDRKPSKDAGKTIRDTVGKGGTLISTAIHPKKSFSNTLDMLFVYLPPGTFMMGSPQNDPCREDDEHQHDVTLTRGIYIQTREVTQGQWTEVMGDNPSSFKDCGDACPVESVSWEDVQRFIETLNAKVGKKRYRLPTEAEWEYACRAGTLTTYSFGDDGDALREYAWYSDNSDNTHPVGQRKPNPWGLYDMHGNVWEWCQDWYGAYPIQTVIDPVGSTGDARVLRGGSWRDSAVYSRSASRHWCRPGAGSDIIGFRLVCLLDQ